MLKPIRKRRVEMKAILNKKVVSAVMITTILLTALFINGSADGTIPGSEADPVVTQSYVELKSEQTKYYIDSLIAQNKQEVASLKTQLEQKSTELLELKQKVDQLSGGGSSVAMESVLIVKGKTLLTGAGTEVILRSGAAAALKGVGGGLADVTKGKDLTAGEIVSYNHLLISAREDGRGIKITQDAYVMIRGAYTIK